jgi:hypothetical protein
VAAEISLSPFQTKIQPFAEALAPLLSKIKPHLPYLQRNIDVLLDEVDADVINNIDPLLYWCGRELQFKPKCAWT